MVFVLLGVVGGVVVGYLVRHILGTKKASSVEHRIEKRIKEAEGRATDIVRKAEGKAAAQLADARKEARELQLQYASLERRLHQREEGLDKRALSLDTREAECNKQVDEVRVREERLEELQKQAMERLESVSHLSREEAQAELFRQLKEAHREELTELLYKLSHDRQEEVDAKAREVITAALERCARSHVSEVTTTTFPLEDEELKGKIIGREGRNIRALERETGVEFVIDETPDTIVISSFDPYRREIARLALKKLIKDGRIQPAKIEEKVEEARQELEKRTLEIGEEAAAEVGMYDLPKEILQLVGRLQFRTSYGQNVLTHSLEMAHIAGAIAAELGLDVQVAKKGALLHDIGKAIDHEVEGTHVDIGVKILKKFAIDEKVILAMRSHHDEYPYASPEAHVVTTADVLSAARPGARRGTLETYIKRLGDLERIATEFEGVKQAYAVSAGRELRIFVTPEKIDDFGALELARQIANRIQAELHYPGEIKVSVIREMRAVEYAR